MRTEQRKQEERRKQDLETRRRVLNAILDKVSLPLSKADLELIAREFLNRLSNEYRTLLSERHASSVTKGKAQKKTDEASLKNLDEAGYGRLLIEIALLDAGYNAYSREGAATLEATAKRYRIHVQRIGESVAAEFAVRRRKRLERASGKASRKTARAAKGAA